MFDLSQNYFDLFGLKLEFHVDSAALLQCYRDIQKQVHPDKFADKSQQEQRVAAQATAFVNEAYQCLKNPLQRAEYLLKLSGQAVQSDAITHNDTNFLFAQMELRERLEQLTQQQNPEAALDDFLDELSEKEKSVEARFVAAYEHKDYEQAKDHVFKWHFWVKLRADAEKLAGNFD